MAHRVQRHGPSFFHPLATAHPPMDPSMDRMDDGNPFVDNAQEPDRCFIACRRTVHLRVHCNCRSVAGPAVQASVGFVRSFVRPGQNRTRTRSTSGQPESERTIETLAIENQLESRE